MKVILNRTALVAALTDVAHVIEPRNTIPILGNVHLDTAGEVGGGTLVLTGTDLDLELRRHTAATVLAHGTATVNAATLLKLVRKLPGNGDCDVTLELMPTPRKDEPKLAVTSGKARFDLVTLPPADFPVMDSKAWQAVFSVPAAIVWDALTKVAPAMSTEESRHYLRGVFLEYAKEGLRMVATDGHRLACKTLRPLPADSGARSAAHVIIPQKTVVELLRLTEKCTGGVAICTHPERISITGPGFSLLSKVVDGTFPDYRRVVPHAAPYGFTLRSRELLTGLDLVTAIADSKARAVACTVDDSTATLRVTNLDAGTASHVLERVAGAMPDKPFEFGFNARYMATIAKLMGGDMLDLAFMDDRGKPDARAPMLITDQADSGVFFVLMPMRV